MKTPKHIAFLLLAAAFVSCSDAPEEQSVGNVLSFSVSHEWPDETPLSRSSWDNMGFVSGDQIEVFACYQEQANASSFSPNFMNQQTVNYDGFNWSYSPLKYWPVNGHLKFCSWTTLHEKNPNYLKVLDTEGLGRATVTYECRTGLDPLYEANADIDIANGTLSGDVTGNSNGTVKLTFHPAPNRYDIVATADKILYDPEHDAPGEYKECRFLILNFKMWGVYKKAKYSMSEGKWYGHEGMYTKEDPLDMTTYLNRVNVEEVLKGYTYNNKLEWDTPSAVIVGEATESQPHTNLFSKPGFFIPADIADIPGNEAGFEIQYVILTNEYGKTDYKETGVITRTGSLKKAFDESHNGRVTSVTDINLHFSIEELTVTVTLKDYTYKPMF